MSFFIPEGLKRFSHSAAAAEPAAAAKKPLPPANAFLRIGEDDTVTVSIAHSEMGQGIWTTLPMLINEELEADWGRFEVEHAPSAPAYAHTAFGMQMTGGSSTSDAGADRVLGLPPDEAFQALAGRRFDAILVMSHSYETDLAHLSHWTDEPDAFLGIVGPVSRREALLRELGDRGRILEPRLAGPVGLPLGGDGPEAIALSIAAQLQRHFSGIRGD